MRTKYSFLILTTAISFSAAAQIIDPRATTKGKAEDRANSQVDRTIDNGFDKIDEGIGKLFKKKGNRNTNENSSGGQESNTSNGSTGIQENNTHNSNTKSNSKFNFVPGSQILYFDDFQRVDIGDFPAEFNTNASGEVVQVNGKNGKWLSMNKNGFFLPENIKELPDNFTLEFEVGLIGNPGNNYSGLGINFTTNNDDLFKDILFFEGSSILYLHPGGDLASVQILPKNGTEINNDIPMPQWSERGKRFAKISIWRQKGRLRLYVDENKLVDMPRFFTENTPYKVAFFRRFFEDCEVVITNIRYAIAGADTRSRLLNDGKFVTNEILFDVNSDRIKSESNTILKEIGAILKENNNLQLKIIGHTDSDGADQDNQALSTKRAAAVKSYLVNNFGINGSRLQTEGKGESIPLQSNNTSAGKAQNRRVEFIKL